MNERLPDKCACLIDKLSNAICNDGCIGFNVKTSKLNRFVLAVKQHSNIYELCFHWTAISVPDARKLFEKRWPDFLLKPIDFINIHDFCSRYSIDEESLARAVFNGIRRSLKADLSWNKSGCRLRLRSLSMNDYEHEYVQKESKDFTSFSEFLVWLDLSSV